LEKAVQVTHEPYLLAHSISIYTRKQRQANVEKSVAMAADRCLCPVVVFSHCYSAMETCPGATSAQYAWWLA
jgi:hypothetical protein